MSEEGATWQLTIDCTDPARLVSFWAPVLGYRVQPPPPGHATWNDWYLSMGVPAEELDPDGDGSDRIFDPTGRGPTIWFQPVPEAKVVKNRFHFDIYPPGGRDREQPWAERVPSIDARVAALVEAGASVRNRTVDEAHHIYTAVMLDPEGNEFCVA